MTFTQRLNFGLSLTFACCSHNLLSTGRTLTRYTAILSGLCSLKNRAGCEAFVAEDPSGGRLDVRPLSDTGIGRRDVSTGQ